MCVHVQVFNYFLPAATSMHWSTSKSMPWLFALALHRDTCAGSSYLCLQQHQLSVMFLVALGLCCFLGFMDPGSRRKRKNQCAGQPQCKLQTNLVIFWMLLVLQLVLMCSSLRMHLAEARKGIRMRRVQDLWDPVHICCKQCCTVSNHFQHVCLIGCYTHGCPAAFSVRKQAAQA